MAQQSPKNALIIFAAFFPYRPRFWAPVFELVLFLGLCFHSLSHQGTRTHTELSWGPCPPPNHPFTFWEFVGVAVGFYGLLLV